MARNGRFRSGIGEVTRSSVFWIYIDRLRMPNRFFNPAKDCLATCVCTLKVEMLSPRKKLLCSYIFDHSQVLATLGFVALNRRQ